MKNNIFAFLLTYGILSLYFNLVPILFLMNDLIRFFHIILFFPFAFLLAKLFYGRGLDSFGFVFPRGWGRNLVVGLLTGAFFWTLLFGIYIATDKIEYIGIKSPTESIVPIAILLFGFGTGSLINDMLVRGLVFHHFLGKYPVPVVFLISLLLYAFDDIWYAGFSLQNTIFSIILGLSLTFTYYKTKSIWANTGIHFGLNIIYGLFYGVTGNPGDGVILFTNGTNVSLWTNWISTIISLLMFVVLLLTIHFYTVPIKRSKNGIVEL
ncbi:CPBP family intramembrane glutamic endopeptidase [Fredinandcohnia humi]